MYTRYKLYMYTQTYVTHFSMNTLYTKLPIIVIGIEDNGVTSLASLVSRKHNMSTHLFLDQA